MCWRTSRRGGAGGLLEKARIRRVPGKRRCLGGSEGCSDKLYYFNYFLEIGYISEWTWHLVIRSFEIFFLFLKLQIKT
jgi:hypothetical protein